MPALRPKGYLFLALFLLYTCNIVNDEQSQQHRQGCNPIGRQHFSVIFPNFWLWVQKSCANDKFESLRNVCLSTSLVVKWIPAIDNKHNMQWPPNVGLYKRPGKYYVKLFLDKDIKKTAVAARGNVASWNEAFYLWVQLQNGSNFMRVWKPCKRHPWFFCFGTSSMCWKHDYAWWLHRWSKRDN